VKASEIVDMAREVLGTPYQHQGRIGHLALDCAGVPAHVARRLEMDFTDVTRYGRQPVPHEMKAALDGALQRVPLEQLQIGDVVWIRFEKEPQHLAILGDHPNGGFTLIHAYNAAGFKEVIEHRLDAKWRARIHAAWRFHGVEL
jgi:cell wall-associated NlpC family hydrolase